MRAHQLIAPLAAVAALFVGAGAAAAPPVPPNPIVGGSPASPGEYPAQGLLQSPAGACGGSLVGSRWFLTAAHCVTDVNGVPIPAADFLVGLGHVMVDQITDIYAVSSVDIHVGYDPNTQVNDVAMLKLARPAPYGFQRVIGADETSKWAPGTPARIIGWGTTQAGGGGPTSNDLLEADVPIVSDTSCLAAYGFAFDPATMVCAWDGTHDTCLGDSGGPLLVPDGGGFALAGVTSWGVGCADPVFPGVYTRVGAPPLNSWVMARFPRASFSTGPAHTDQPIPFTSTSFHPEPGGFTTFRWDFDNDGAFDDATGATVTASLSAGLQPVAMEASAFDSDRAVTRQLVSVNGTPRAVAAGGETAYQVREGGIVTVNGSAIDPEGQPLVFAWDLDGDGTFETPGTSPTFSAVRIDGPVTRAVTVRACDPPGACATASALVRVSNVAPRPNAGRDRRTTVRRKVRFAAGVADRGFGDTKTFRWRFGDRRHARGRIVRHAYRRPGRYVVTLIVRDDDGGVGVDRLRIRVTKKKRR
jgi:secreted trypsin-like serine protease